MRIGLDGTDPINWQTSYSNEEWDRIHALTSKFLETELSHQSPPEVPQLPADKNYYAEIVSKNDTHMNNLSL